MTIKKVAIISLGWLGQKLYHSLKDDYVCSGSYFSESKGIGGEFHFDLNDSFWHEAIEDCDIIFFNLPPSSIQNMNNAKEFFKHYHSKRIIFISSTAVYENLTLANEKSKLVITSERVKKLRELESFVESSCVNYLIIRCAGLYGEGRHPGNFLSGRTNISEGNTTVNLVGDTDLIILVEKILERSDELLINAVNIHHPKKKDYYKAFCINKNLKLPQFKEEGTEKIVETFYQNYKIKSQLP